MPSTDITKCPGSDAQLCASCWRNLCPAQDRQSWASWTVQTRGRAWCEGYLMVSVPAGNLREE